jgi:hypothetical protein
MKVPLVYDSKVASSSTVLFPDGVALKAILVAVLAIGAAREQQQQSQ